MNSPYRKKTEAQNSEAICLTDEELSRDTDLPPEEALLLHLHDWSAAALQVSVDFTLHSPPPNTGHFFCFFIEPSFLVFLTSLS